MDKPKEPVMAKTENELANEFIREYQELCEKHQFQIVVTPAWRVSQDTGDWRMVLQSSVGRLPKENLNDGLHN